MQISRNDIVGVVASTFFFIVVFILTWINIEERLLNEGAKELISVINSRSFFLIHPERILFCVSQIFPLIGLKLGWSLNSIILLYSFNVFMVSGAIYLLCCLVFRDYYAGIYLCSFQIIGMGYNFFLYPFLEHIYGLLFCYLLFHLLRKYEAGKSKWLLIILPLIALITTIHPVCIVLISLLVVQTKLPFKSKVSLLFFSGLFFIMALFLTEVSIRDRAGGMSFQRIPHLFFLFVKGYVDLIVMLIVTGIVVIKSTNRWFLVPLFGISILPYIFYGQFPLCYFMLPCGFGLLLILTETNVKPKPIWMIFIGVLFILNVIRIELFQPVYTSILRDVNTLIAKARTAETNKLILVYNSETEYLFKTELEFPLDESIKHSSLLFSSRKGPEYSVMIDSYDFTKDAYGQNIGETLDNQSKIDFMTGLYDKEIGKTLYPKYFNQYEYCKYFFTNNNLNQKYFGISPNKPYQMLNP